MYCSQNPRRSAPSPLLCPADRRRRRPTAAAGLLLLLALVAACGKKGPPLPPLRYVPAATDDLSIHQQGTILIFEFGYPRTTVDGRALSGIEAVEIWELVLPVPPDTDLDRLPEIDAPAFAGQAQRLLVLQGPELTSAVVGDSIEARIPLHEPLPEDRELHVFGVRTIADTLEVSSFSNLVQLLLQQPIDPPHSLSVSGRADGVEVRWVDEGSDALGYHVYRRPAAARGYGAPRERLDAEADRYLDTSARFGERYIYTVRAIASRNPLIESGPAGEQEIDYQDRFPPAPPNGLLALAEAQRIRLVWEESPDEDVVGYHLYRQDPGSDFRRITEAPVEGLEYLDRGLSPGLTYLYRATAVDDVGNEGEPGTTTSATAQ